MHTPYSAEIEELMQRLYQSLSEKDRRRFAAFEALSLGHGGRGYICAVLGCDYKTLQRGETELHDEDALNQDRIRRPGGGAKKNWSSSLNCIPPFSPP